MNLPSLTVRVSAIRSQSPQGRGGAIFTGIEVDERGTRRDAKAHLVVKAPHWLLTTAVEVGQFWRVTGKTEANTIIVNGYRLTESTLTPEAMELLRPSGEHIVTLLAECDAFAGIGMVKARHLWDHFGQDLYSILDNRDVKRLEEVMTTEAAANLTDAWRRWGDTFTLQWLQAKGFPVALGRKVIAYLSPHPAVQIERDPYRLISFAADWATTDKLACDAFGIAEDDPRRLVGAVEEALYGAFDAGHTCVSRSEVAQRVSRLLGSGDLTDHALAKAEARGCFLRQNLRSQNATSTHATERLHAVGPYVMERGIAESIAQRAAQPDPLLNHSELAAVLADYQAESGITLEASQIDALAVANGNPIAVITGGAGTGKTTVLRACFLICAEAGWPVCAMALSGRAARRISEATGYPATTIAGFLASVDAGTLPERAVVVIDEASMLDLPAAYRLIRHLPETYRFVLVGDPHQLPPVGPGLLLHELAHHDGIPRVELQQVKRYGGKIAEAATAIRQGQWPDLPDEPKADIAFLPCALNEINDTVLDLLTDDPQNSQILCATRTAAAGGVKAINTLCSAALHASSVELLRWNAEFEAVQGTGFRVGSPVICLINDWEKNLQNGSLGVIVSVEPPDRVAQPGQRLGVIRWDDGQERDLTPDLLPHLELAYAITIHKAQGSQFPRIIVPVRHSRLLDRTLLYTAITRAQQQVILVGDVAAAKAAVEAPPHASLRQVALGSLLTEILEGMA